MAWLITGKKLGLVLGVSDSGAPICHGQGTHDCIPLGLNDFGGNIDHTLLKRIQEAECGWTIAASTESELHIDGGGEGLFERVQNAPDKSHGMAKFYSHSSDTVAFVIVVPETMFSHVRRLLELVLTSEALQYVIAVEFLGFRVPHAQTATPTWEEFVAGRPLFFNEMSISVRLAENDAYAS
jgi:hypothetical protein